MQYRAAYGDGGFSELQSAIRIHGNAVEYIPIAIVLMLFMEMNGAETRMVHICGIVLLAGRLMHYYGFHHRLFRWRRSGMSATVCAVADGAGGIFGICPGVGFLPALAHNTPLFFPGFYVMSHRDTLFFCPYRQTGDWTFDERVAEVFPDMIQRSVPGYSNIISMIGMLAERFVQPVRRFTIWVVLWARRHSRCVATFIMIIAKLLPSITPAMIERCRRHIDAYKAPTPVDVIEGDIRDIAIENASMVVLNFTPAIPRTFRAPCVTG